MAKVIVIANQKGGVAKTTTTAAMSSLLCDGGKHSVLAIDLDPQGNLSYSSGAEVYEYITIYDVLAKRENAEDAIQKLPDFDIIPGNIALAGVDREMNDIGKEFRLKESLAPIQEAYDYILIDTPPSLGVLTVNALAAADEVIIPTTAGIYAATGINQLFNIIASVQQYYNRDIRVAGILITKHNPKTNVGRNIKELTGKLAETMQTKLFDTYIRSSVAVEDAQLNQQDIFRYANTSTVAADYRAFVAEYLAGDNHTASKGEE